MKASILILALAIPLHAQEKKPAPKPPQLKVDDLQRAKLDAAQAHIAEISQRKNGEALREQAPYNDEMNRVIHQIAAQNPDYYWNEKIGWFSLKPEAGGKPLEPVNPPVQQAPPPPAK